MGGPGPVVVTLTQGQLETLQKTIREEMSSIVTKMRDSSGVSFRSDQFAELKESFLASKKEMISVMDAAADSILDRCVRTLQQTAEDFQNEILKYGGKIEAVLSKKLEEVVDRIERLKDARIQMDPDTLTQLLTHARKHLYDAVSEAREHLTTHLIEDMRQGISGIIGHEVRAATNELKEQKSGNSLLMKLGAVCAILTAVAVGVAYYFTYKAVRDFKPPVLDFKIGKDGKLIPSAETAQAVRDHAFSFTGAG